MALLREEDSWKLDIAHKIVGYAVGCINRIGSRERNIIIFPSSLIIYVFIIYLYLKITNDYISICFYVTPSFANRILFFLITNVILKNLCSSYNSSFLHSFLNFKDIFILICDIFFMFWSSIMLSYNSDMFQLAISSAHIRGYMLMCSSIYSEVFLSLMASDTPNTTSCISINLPSSVITAQTIRKRA